MLRYVVACLIAGAWFAVPSAARAQDKIPLSGAVAETDIPDSKRPSLFDEVEPVVTASPSNPVSIALPAGTVVVDFEVSPLGDEVGLVTEDKTHHQQIAFWRFSTRELGRTIDVPADTRVASLTWQPKGKSLFLLAGRGAKSVIFSLDPAATAFAPAVLLSSEKPLRRLVVGPRPFEVTDNQPSFRLFFGEKQPDGSYQLRTVTDDGKQIYTVIGPKKDPMHKEDEEGPNTAIAPSALPVGFHPAGNRLIWEDNAQCLHRLGYELDNWGKIEPFGHGCGHIEAYTPNGAATLEWAPKVPGIRVHGLFDKSDRAVLSDFMLVSVPSQAPDGRGVVAVTADAGINTLRYLPIDAPLAEVANAWMYLAHADDQKRFVEDRGLFRSLAQDEQLYQLYDSESYYCGGPDPRVPTRPYYVTTDLFWELYGAAFEGLFIVLERAQAMPAFERFVHGAADGLAAHQGGTALAKAFASARAVLDGTQGADPEAQLIVVASGPAKSPALGEEIDYAQFKPRGHYTTDVQKRYFAAMRYLSQIKLSDADAATLKTLGPDVAKAAETWISTYRAFIAAPRLDVVFGASAKSAVASHDGPAGARFFPLSWGWDNEALDNVIDHSDRPAAERIVDSGGGGRFLPSALDFAAIAGNSLAYRLLEQDGRIAKYANLAARIQALRPRFAASKTQPPATLYDRWIDALAVQWADAASTPQLSGPLWASKRLQTGLASWATLRHSTVLVNDQSAAECGEAGFEAIVMRPPRGYVEPDPETFAAIAGLFDGTIAVVKSSRFVAGDDGADKQLREGIVRRLSESRDNAAKYQKIAEKERHGQALTSDDYEAIQYVGRAAEHNFLIFTSLANPDYALSTPDPMMKIADVAGAGGQAGSLEVAVGRPLEWDQIVPFYGRTEIVKGSTYSYYEFANARPMDDAAWRKSVDTRKPPDWVARFVSPAKLACPAPQP